MQSVNRRLAEIKKSERALILKRHEEELTNLDRDIAALLRAASIEESMTEKQPPEIKERASREELYRNRSALIIAILKDAGSGDVYHKDIADKLKMHPESVKDWMQKQMEVHADCPWTFGRSKSYFRLTDIYRAGMSE